MEIEGNQLPEIETTTITTNSGDEIEVVRVEAFQQYQEQISSTLSETKSTLEAVNSELEKERQKDKNFSNLRKAKLSELSEQEAAKLSEREKSLMAQAEDLDNRVTAFETQQINSYKAKALHDLGVTDEDDQKKVLGQFDRLKDDAKTEAEIISKMRTAYSLAYEGRVPTGSRGVDTVVPYGGSRIGGAKSQFSETQKQLGNLLGFNSVKDQK